MSRAFGVGERQLLELQDYKQSDAFDDLERAAIDLAVAMAATPANVPPELTAGLEERLGERGLIELCSAIAWEHYRSRFNRALDVKPAGFSDGAVCVLPAHRT